jgi:hypothetical protein
MSRAAAAPQQKQKPLCGGACGPQEEPPARTSARVAGMARRRGRSSEPGRAREAVRSGPFTGRAEAYPVGKALSRVRAVRENSDVVAAASESQVGGRNESRALATDKRPKRPADDLLAAAPRAKRHSHPGAKSPHRERYSATCHKGDSVWATPFGSCRTARTDTAIARSSTATAPVAGISTSASSAANTTARTRTSTHDPSHFLSYRGTSYSTMDGGRSSATRRSRGIGCAGPSTR